MCATKRKMGACLLGPIMLMTLDSSGLPGPECAVNPQKKAELSADGSIRGITQAKPCKLRIVHGFYRPYGPFADVSSALEASKLPLLHHINLEYVKNVAFKLQKQDTLNENMTSSRKKKHLKRFRWSWVGYRNPS